MGVLSHIIHTFFGKSENPAMTVLLIFKGFNIFPYNWKEE